MPAIFAWGGYVQGAVEHMGWQFQCTGLFTVHGEVERMGAIQHVDKS